MIKTSFFVVFFQEFYLDFKKLFKFNSYFPGHISMATSVTVTLTHNFIARLILVLRAIIACHPHEYKFWRVVGAFYSGPSMKNFNLH